MRQNSRHQCYSR